MKRDNDSGSAFQTHRTLDINEAAKFLGAHKETIRRMVASGDIPGFKTGRKWMFFEQDLVMYIRNKYSSPDALSGVYDRRDTLWHSKRRMVSGGSMLPTVENEYAKALKLR